MQKYEKGFIEAALMGEEIPALMQELGFDAFETTNPGTRQPVIIYKRDVNQLDRWKIEYSVFDCQITCYQWNDEPGAERWAFLFECKLNHGLVDRLQTWMLILHMAGIITIGKLLMIANESCKEEEPSLFQNIANAIRPSETIQTETDKGKVSNHLHGLVSTALNLAQ